MPEKVICAMSGGVDSSVAAALLKKQGFNVIGVFMKFWAGQGSKQNQWNRCCSPESEKRAREAARMLGIPFYVFNFKREFKKKVVAYFLREYKAGATPNPCVVCNKDIKFGLLLQRGLALKADYLATGHYARKRGSRLLRAKDKEKDQSYFLWQLNQKQLKRVIFPVGGYTKKETRALALKLGLSTASVSDSQEVCFVKDTVEGFLKQYLREKPGKMVDDKGRVLGEHRSLAHYTIGQRKGIGLPGGPYFVMAKDLKKNLLILTKDEKDLLRKELSFKKASWISGKAPKLPVRVKAKIRYRHKEAQGTISQGNKFVFNKPQRAITPGQSVVFYRGEEMLGGGIID